MGADDADKNGFNWYSRGNLSIDYESDGRIRVKLNQIRVIRVYQRLKIKQKELAADGR